jgi:hypothetical protein
LNLLAHGDLQIELAIPHLRQIATLLQRVSEIEQIGPEERVGVELFDCFQMFGVNVFAQRFLTFASIAYERFEHCAHHVKLSA